MSTRLITWSSHTTTGTSLSIAATRDGMMVACPFQTKGVIPTHVQPHLTTSVGQTDDVFTGDQLVEPISSARIAPEFRPMLNNGHHVASQPLASSTSNTSSTQTETEARTSIAAASVHKMDDNALVLGPRQELKNLIDEFLH